MPTYRRTEDEAGFSLVELLVVILIIGILAAIALPAMTHQRNKGFDADAKANAKNAVTAMESCFIARNRTYTGCDLSGAGLPVGSAPGDVAALVAGDGRSYTVAARSRSGTYWNVTSGGVAQVRCKASAAAACGSSDETW
jgi:type IV pilus assembly protein PilA